MTQTDWRVIILPSGAHYDCASEAQARSCFENAPQTDEETGRQLLADGVLVAEETAP